MILALVLLYFLVGYLIGLLAVRFFDIDPEGAIAVVIGWPLTVFIPGFWLLDKLREHYERQAR